MCHVSSWSELQWNSPHVTCVELANREKKHKQLSAIYAMQVLRGVPAQHHRVDKTLAETPLEGLCQIFYKRRVPRRKVHYNNQWHFSTSTFGHAELNRANLFFHHWATPTMDLPWRRAKLGLGLGDVSRLQPTHSKTQSPPQIDTHLGLCRKTEIQISLKVGVFSSQYFCSFWLNLFSFSHSVCQTSAAFTVSTCLLSAVSGVMFSVCCWRHNVSCNAAALLYN